MSNFRPINRDTGFLLPPSVDEWLPQRHLARFVVEPPGTSRVASISLYTRAAVITPAEWQVAFVVRFPRHNSLPGFLDPVGLRIYRFRGLLNVHCSLQPACSLESPEVTRYQRLQPSRYLHGRSDCYRLERQLPGGSNSR